MKAFFATIGTGILYFLLLPFLIVYIAIWMALMLLMWIKNGLFWIISFFSGKNYFHDAQVAELNKRKRAGMTPVSGTAPMFQQPTYPQPVPPYPPQPAAAPYPPQAVPPQYPPQYGAYPPNYYPNNGGNQGGQGQ